MDDAVDNFAGRFGRLGIAYACARKSEGHSDLSRDCAQNSPHRCAVADVTYGSEVFCKIQRLERCLMRVVSSLT